MYSVEAKSVNEGKIVKLDANESPVGAYNRYPEMGSLGLRSLLARQRQVDISNVMLGNGSDELIDLAVRAICKPGKDAVMVYEPCFSMYRRIAQINDVNCYKAAFGDLLIDDLAELCIRANERCKLMFLCSPNNPTGEIIPRTSIEFILKNFEGIVVLDEAYIEFSEEPSALDLISKYDNLLVLQTMSKARAMAGIRIGFAFGHPHVISAMLKIQMPYSISVLNQGEAKRVLEKESLMTDMISEMRTERDKLLSFLKQLPYVNKIFKSHANFLCIQLDNAEEIYGYLMENGILVRKLEIENRAHLRISIGTKEENDLLIKTLKAK